MSSGPFHTWDGSGTYGMHLPRSDHLNFLLSFRNGTQHLDRYFPQALDDVTRVMGKFLANIFINFGVTCEGASGTYHIFSLLGIVFMACILFDGHLCKYASSAAKCCFP